MSNTISILLSLKIYKNVMTLTISKGGKQTFPPRKSPKETGRDGIVEDADLKL